MEEQKIIVLDCDGVLVDYKKTYGTVWNQFFNDNITVKNPNSYFVENYYGVTLDESRQKDFFDYFNKYGWSLMTPLDQAVEATHSLREAGYKILVVTSISKIAQELRHQNLLDLGFAVDATIATGLHCNNINPKKTYIETLNPEYFVDDFIHNFHDIHNKTHMVLVDFDADDSPNRNIQEAIKLHSTHNSLWEFVNTHIK